MLLDHGDSTRFDPALMALLQAVCRNHFPGHRIWRGLAQPEPTAGSRPAASHFVRSRQARRSRIGRIYPRSGGSRCSLSGSDLKVATLARHLREPDYRISRAITAGLGERNFNRFINRYRINHAKDLLRANPQGTGSILDVALTAASPRSARSTAPSRRASA